MEVGLVDDQEGSAYIAETEDGDYVGEIRYTLRPSYVDVWHTEVDDRWAGQGMAGKMTKLVLDEIQKRNLKVYPRCPFMAGYIEKHTEYKELVYN
ncbi:MAG: N-acetyltransferase [Candidatus Ancillula sp.]|jgi:predicted GNAT family acetyltransferase|nr:N-acetyltransferase [Candidatus Ancillula sp.]